MCIQLLSLILQQNLIKKKNCFPDFLSTIHGKYFSMCLQL